MPRQRQAAEQLQAAPHARRRARVLDKCVDNTRESCCRRQSAARRPCSSQRGCTAASPIVRGTVCRRRDGNDPPASAVMVAASAGAGGSRALDNGPPTQTCAGDADAGGSASEGDAAAPTLLRGVFLLFSCFVFHFPFSIFYNFFSQNTLIYSFRNHQVVYCRLFLHICVEPVFQLAEILLATDRCW